MVRRSNELDRLLVELILAKILRAHKKGNRSIEFSREEIKTLLAMYKIGVTFGRIV